MTRRATTPTVADLGDVTPRPTKDLRLSEGNPRVIPDQAVELLALSLRRFGWQQPIVIEPDGQTVVAGHTRLLAAQKLGLKTVPTVMAEQLSPEDLKAYRIADNRTHDFTAWDLPALSEQLDALSGNYADVLALADWEAIVDQFEGAQGDTDPDLDLSDGAAAALDGFALTVMFSSKDAALAAETGLLDIPGVTDVRHKF